MFNQFLITIADVNGYDVRASRDMYDTSLSCYAALISKKSFFLHSVKGGSSTSD